MTDEAAQADLHAMMLPDGPNNGQLATGEFLETLKWIHKSSATLKRALCRRESIGFCPAPPLSENWRLENRIFGFRAKIS